MADTDTERPVSSSPYDYPPRRISDDESERNKEKAEVTIDINDDKDTTKSNEMKDDDMEEEVKKENEKPLLEDKSIKIEGDDTSTLPLPEKKKKSLDDSELERKQREKLPVYLFPFTRIKDAWTDSTNIFQFMGSAVCIIFQTVGWFTCIGGIPFLSLVMLVIGSIYVDDCNIEPNIPVYLIVSGVIGTIQHVLNVWTQYVPKKSQGRLKVYRNYCQYLHGVFHFFLMIWFILGCVWVYGAHADVEYRDSSKREYCHKTLYLFSFWILNLSFILLGLLVFLSICFLVCIIASGN